MRKSPLLPITGAILFRQLAIAERHALPSREVLDILVRDPELFGEQTPAITALAGSLRDGTSLADGMQRLPGLFAAETATLLRQAESDARRASVLDTLADDYQRVAQSREALREATAWPTVLSVGVLMLATFYMVLVVPALTEIYQQFGADLPSPTTGIIAVSHLLTHYWWVWLLPTLALIAAWALGRMPATLANGVQEAIGRLPFVRRYLAATYMARLLGWLRVCDGKPLLMLAALRHLRAGTELLLWRELLDSLEGRLENGTALANALLDLPPLPQRLGLFMQLGERTGDSATELTQLIEQTAFNETIALNRLVRSLTLLVYIVLGSLVGFLVVAIYLPIFKLGTVI